jgi:hypothetical protein
VHFLIVIESETCHIHKVILQAINIAARTPSGVLELVGIKNTVNKVILEVELLLFKELKPV